MSAKRQFSEHEQRQIVHRYDGGESRSSIAGSFRASRDPIDRVLRDHGRELRDDSTRNPSKVGANHPSWKGGRWIDSQGYVHIWVAPDDPMRVMAHSGGYVLEHRLVMGRALGRPLSGSEEVHHRDNRDRSNNDLSNLELRITAHGAGAAFCCADCGSTNIVTAGERVA